MTSDSAELTEEGRTFLQQRVALYGKALFAINMLGLIPQVGMSARGQLLRPWFGFYLAITALCAGVWLLCRTGKRSARVVYLVDSVALLSIAAAVTIMGRLMVSDKPPGWIAVVVGPGESAYGPLVGTYLVSMNLALIIAMSLFAFLRAALVPSRALRTAVLTGLVGVPLAVIPSLSTVPFEDARSLRLQMPDAFVGEVIIGVVIWWTFITIVCTLVSRVIFGLRRQVREARRLGQYTLETKLGEGGMGTVYRASHAMMRRPTAIKLLRPGRAAELNLARFEREVQLTARLTHPNTVTIFDYGRTPDGIFYYAMELLDGATLEDVVRVDGPQPPGRVIKVLAEVAGALEEAHGVGLIHRDIKPSNVILSTQGGKPDVAKLLDFGLIKDLSEEQEDVDLTKDGTLTGTPMYMCPEQLATPDAVDARSDLYSLGAVGYFVLTGEPVFEGNTLVQVCGHHLHSEPVPPSERLGEAVPEDLEQLLLSCLAKEPSERPQSAAELHERLHDCRSMGEWDEARARRWWEQHGEAIRADRPAADGSTETRALALDLARHVGSTG